MLAGGIPQALERAHRNRQGNQPIEVEVRNLGELDEALNYGAEAILLDNFSVDEVRLALDRIARLPKKLAVEVAGGITLDNVRSYAETGVTFISVGALSLKKISVDLSMRIGPV